MKKLLFTLLLGGLVCACTSNQFDDLAEDIESADQYPEKTVRGNPGDGKFDALGNGYDITGTFLDVTSVKSGVIDIEKFVSMPIHKGRVDYPTTGRGKMHYYYGANSEDFQKDIITKANVNASAGLKIPIIGSFSRTLNGTYETESKYFYSTKYSFASADLVKRIKGLRVIPTTPIDTLKNYLTINFKNDVKAVTNATTKNFIAAYGTHVLLDIAIGGRLNFTYKSSIVTENSTEKKKNIVKAGINNSLLGMSLEVDGTIDRETIKTLNKENKNATLTIEYSGGDFPKITYDLEKRDPTVDLENWSKAVALTNAALIDVNWQRAIPIYEFISDPTKKALIKAAVDKYISDAQEKALEIVPLREWRSNKERNHIFSIDVNFIPGNGNRPDYFLQDNEKCYVHITKVAESVPLYQWFSSKELNYIYTTDANWFPPNRPDYSRHGIICYVYNKQVPGTVPMYQWYSREFLDYYYTTNARKNDLGNEWVKQGVAFYVFPADGDWK